MKGESTRNRCGHSLRGSSGSTHTRPRGHTRPARQSPCTRCVRNSSPSRCHRHAQSTACTRAPPPRWRSADSSARRASLMPRSTGYGTRCTRTRSALATRSRRGLVRGPLAWAQRVPEVTIGVWAHPPHKALPRWRCPSYPICCSKYRNNTVLVPLLASSQRQNKQTTTKTPCIFEAAAETRNSAGRPGAGRRAPALQRGGTYAQVKCSHARARATFPRGCRVLSGFGLLLLHKVRPPTLARPVASAARWPASGRSPGRMRALVAPAGAPLSTAPGPRPPAAAGR